MPPKYKNKFEMPKSELPNFSTLTDIPQSQYDEHPHDNYLHPSFHWAKYDQPTHEFLMESTAGVDFVSNNENRDTTLQALVDKFKKDHGLEIDLKQIKYHLTNPLTTFDTTMSRTKDTKVIAEREQLNKELTKRYGKALGSKAGKDGPLWSYATDKELDKPYMLSGSNYTNMYFDVLKSVTKQLSDKMIAEGKSVDERKEALRGLLYDFGTTMTGVYAACGGFKNNPDPEGGRFPRENRTTDILYNPMFGDISVDRYNERVNELLPKEFLRTNDLEKPVDIATINSKTEFEPGEILYLGNEVRLAQQKSAKHGKVARWFADLPFFCRMKFAKEIQKDDAHLRDMERVALKFAPVKGKNEAPYKDNAEKLQAGVKAITDLADKIANNQVIDVATTLREQTKQDMLRKADTMLAMLVLRDSANTRFKSISLNSARNRIQCVYNRVYGEVALNKIAEATDCPDLIIEDNENSVGNFYSNDTSLDNESYQPENPRLDQKFTSDNAMKYLQINGNIETGDDGAERFDYWMKQVHKGLGTHNAITAVEIKSEEELVKNYDTECQTLSADFNENTMDIKNQVDTLEADQFNKVQKPALRILGQKENAPQVQMVEGSGTQNPELPTKEEGYNALEGAGVLHPERYIQDLPTGNDPEVKEEEKEDEKEPVEVDLKENNLAGETINKDDNSNIISLEEKAK